MPTRTLDWLGSDPNLQVWTPRDLTRLFGAKRGSHIHIGGVTMQSPDTTTVIITEDNAGEMIKVRTNARHNTLANLQLATGRTKGRNSIHFTATTGGTGFQETFSKACDMEIFRNLVFSHNGDDDVILTFLYSFVEGEFWWDQVVRRDNYSKVAWFRAAGNEYHQVIAGGGGAIKQVGMRHGEDWGTA